MDSTSSRAKGGPGPEPWVRAHAARSPTRNCAPGATQSFHVRGFLSREHDLSASSASLHIRFSTNEVFPGSSGHRRQDTPAGPGAPHAPAPGLPPAAPSPPPGRARAHTPPQQPVQVTQYSRGGIQATFCAFPTPPHQRLVSSNSGDCLPICQGAPQSPGWSCSLLLMLLTQSPSSPQRTSA